MSLETVNACSLNHESADPAHFIPDVFRRRVLLHVLKNYISSLTPPLILAIQGPTGCGKTWQTRQTCQDCNIHVLSLSGAALSGEHEKAPVQVLYGAYSRACREGRERKKMAVLVIDDFHLSVASAFSTREYTVNTQLLIGALMNLADQPDVCDQEQIKRTPIIVTGNDFSALYQPLTRHGRMDFFDWQPTKEMTTQILNAIYRPMLQICEQDTLQRLVDAHPDENIAFFATLANRLVDSCLVDLLQAWKIQMRDFEEGVRHCQESFTIDDLLVLAAEQRLSRPRNFVDGQSQQGD